MRKKKITIKDTDFLCELTYEGYLEADGSVLMIKEK